MDYSVVCDDKVFSDLKVI